MDIAFSCSQCGQNLVVDEVAAGTTIDCPKCGKPVYVPSAAANQVPETPEPSVTVATRPPIVAAPTSSRTHQTTSPAQRVTVIDINMPFWSIVRLMVKWALASIPAFIILAIIFFILWVVFGLAGLSLFYHAAMPH